MTLTIHKEEDTQRQLLLTVEVAEERVAKAMRQTAKKLAKDFRIPGFRQGKAPYQVIVNRVGRDALRGETIDEIVPAIFEETMADVDEDEVYGRPELTDMELEPLVLKFTIPLRPTVKLGDYRVLRQDVEPVVITDEAVEEALEQIRGKHQTLETVDRAAEAGDMVTLSGMGKLAAEEVEAVEAADEAEAQDEEGEGETAVPAERVIFAEEQIDLVMDATKVYPDTPFVENVLGLSAGEQTTFSFTFPDDYNDEELAGKEATFDVTVLNVQSRELPELNDELAQQEGDYETLEDLRTETQDNLLRAAESQAKQDLVDDMTDKLLEEAEIVYPPAAVEMELDDMIETFKTQARYSGWEWDDYLQMQGMSEDILRDGFRDSAVTRLQRGLVIRELVLAEKIKVQMEDVDAIIEERISKFESEDLRNSMRQYYESSGFDSISGEVLHEKLFERIKAIFEGAAPGLADLENEDEASEEEE